MSQLALRTAGGEYLTKEEVWRRSSGRQTYPIFTVDIKEAATFDTIPELLTLLQKAAVYQQNVISGNWHVVEISFEPSWYPLLYKRNE